MTTTKGYLIETQGRSLFVRTDAETEWARLDDDYTVVELIDKNDTGGDPDFQDYRDVAEQLYKQQQEQVDFLKARLEEFVEVVEAISEIAVVSENVIENKAIIMLVNQQCKKLLEAKES